jgi:hypothetical protein
VHTTPSSDEQRELARRRTHGGVEQHDDRAEGTPPRTRSATARWSAPRAAREAAVAHREPRERRARQHAPGEAAHDLVLQVEAAHGQHEADDDQQPRRRHRGGRRGAGR